MSINPDQRNLDLATILASTGAFEPEELKYRNHFQFESLRSQPIPGTDLDVELYVELPGDNNDEGEFYECRMYLWINRPGDADPVNPEESAKIAKFTGIPAGEFYTVERTFPGDKRVLGWSDAVDIYTPGLEDRLLRLCKCFTGA